MCWCFAWECGRAPAPNIRHLDTVAFAKFAITLDIPNARAVLRAHRDFRRLRQDYTTHPATDLLDLRPDTRRNILTAYYLRNRHRFDQL